MDECTEVVGYAKYNNIIVGIDSGYSTSFVHVQKNASFIFLGVR